MSDTPTPPALTPHICVADAAAAIEFYRKALGAEELMRLPGPDGRLMHAAVSINGAMLMLNDEYPEMGGFGPAHFGGTAVTFHLGVPDADAAMASAVAAGATVVMPVEEQFWGDRYGMIRDPFGHQWSFATPVRQVSMDEMQSRAAGMS
jgi:PhnB protein